MDFNELLVALVEEEYFTMEELHLVTMLNGDTAETLNACIYARYGYRDWEQMHSDY